jgi:signal transduction histidine kinase
VYNYFHKISYRTLKAGLFILALIYTSAYAQDLHRIDSLNQLLNTQSGINQVETYIELAIEYADFDNARSLEYIETAFSVASQFQDSVKIVEAGRIKGQLLRRLDRMDEAIQLFESLLPTARKRNLTHDLKSILNSLALAYTWKADYNKALDLNFQSLIIREQEGDKAEISIALHNIGLVYFRLKNYEKAVEYYQRALDYKKQVNDTYDMDRLLINIGLCYNNLNRYEEAKAIIEEAQQLCADQCSDEILIEIQFGLGVTHFGLGEYEKSKSNFEESLRISESTDNHRFTGESLFYLGKLELVNENFKRAEELFIKAEKISLDYGFNQLLINVYKEYSNLYAKLKDYEKVSLFQNKYIALKDSLIGEELVKNIAQIQTRFEERQNIATIANKEEELARQRTLNVAIGIIALLSALLVFVLYRNNKAIKHVNSALADAKSVIEHQNIELQSQADRLQLAVDKATADLKVVNNSLRKVNEELDNFIYKTSHDIRGPLASLKGICNVALMDVHDPLALEYLQKLDDTASLLNRILTRLLIINQINRSAISKEKLNLEKIVDDIILLETKKGLPPRLVFERDIQQNIDFYSDDSLVRIILENLIDNAVRFYNDSQRINPFVNIRIWVDGNDLQISVVDNGIGVADVDSEKIFQMFSRASDRSNTGGLGLYLVKQAVERLGGKVGLSRNAQEHTEFTVTLPLELPMEVLVQYEA